MIITTAGAVKALPDLAHTNSKVTLVLIKSLLDNTLKLALKGH